MQLKLVDGFWPQFFTFNLENGDQGLILDALSQMQSLSTTLSMLGVKSDVSYIQFPIKNNKMLQFILDTNDVIAMIYDGDKAEFTENHSNH